MAEDINMDDLAPPDPIEGEPELGKGGGTFVMPPEGLYTGVVSTPPEIGKTREKGYLQFLLNPITVVGGAHDGFEVRYTRINTQKWPNRKSNGVLDYLGAHGIKVVPASNEDYTALVMRTVGRPFPFFGKWEGKCKMCQMRVKGMLKFPVDSVGNRLSRMRCPACSSPEGATPVLDVMIFANLTASSFPST